MQPPHIPVIIETMDKDSSLEERFRKNYYWLPSLLDNWVFDDSDKPSLANLMNYPDTLTALDELIDSLNGLSSEGSKIMVSGALLELSLKPLPG